MTSGQDTTNRVAIVGGGLAGIAATIALSDAGIGVDLFEANQRLGGRVGSFDDPVTGETIDYCQHVGMACCTNLVHLINRLGIEGDFTTEKTLHFFGANGRHLPIKAWPLPAPLHLSGLLLKWPDLTLADRFSIARTLLAMMRIKKTAPALDELAIDWLKARQSQRVIKAFWETILVSALGERIDKVALGPAAKVLLDGFANNRNAYHLLVPQRPLRELFDDHCRKLLENSSKVRLHLGYRIDRITSLENEGHAVVTLTDQYGTKRTYEKAISCVPWYRINDVLEMSANELNALKPSPITGIHTWWDHKWLNFDHAILVNHKCQWLFAQQDDYDDRSGPWYCQIVISGAHDLQWKTSLETYAGLVNDLGDAFPEIKQRQLLRSKMITDPRSVFSVQPGNQKSRWPSDRYSDQGVWLAGDWTDTLWPATMEGAVRSGFQAAQQVAESCGAKIDLPVKELPVGAILRAFKR